MKNRFFKSLSIVWESESCSCFCKHTVPTEPNFRVDAWPVFPVCMDSSIIEGYPFFQNYLSWYSICTFTELPWNLWGHHVTWHSPRGRTWGRSRWRWRTPGPAPACAGWCASAPRRAPARPAGSSRGRWGPCSGPSSSGPWAPPGWHNTLLRKRREKQRGSTFFRDYVVSIWGTRARSKIHSRDFGGIND